MLFGWGQSSKHGKFWWAKNSWGADWPHRGANGVFRMARGVDTAFVESRGVSWVYAGEKKKDKAKPTWCEVPIRKFDDLKEKPTGKCIGLKEGRNRAGRQVCIVSNDCNQDVEVDLYHHSDATICGRSYRPFEIRAGRSHSFEGVVNCCIRSAELKGGSSASMGGSGGFGGMLNGPFGGGGDDNGRRNVRRGSRPSNPSGGENCVRAVQHGSQGCQITNSCAQRVHLHNSATNPNSFYAFNPGQSGMVREPCRKLKLRMA